MSEPATGAGPGSLEHARTQIGRAFPGGEYTIEPYQAWLFADAVLADPADPQPHPVFAWWASVSAKGVSWDEFFAWFGAGAEDGPMFGEHETTLYAPLRTNVAYAVTGEVTSVDRKQGRKAGAFDIVGYRFELHERDSGVHVASCWNSIVFPRRNA
ncbi:hypothetical protein [Granulicoccus phenolivorans]|uniref:hypothetical protein n=1 Tax=Granulicoccus phenolivorans TaxID=266854 RepID=UPI000414609F|nr:hypothetical protein [Granulicoccus phenolivorans]